MGLGLIGVFFLKHWKWFLVGGIVVALGIGAWLLYRHVYKLGYNSCVNEVLIEQEKDDKEREKEYIKIYIDREKEINKIKDDIKKNPIDDERDSCFLSERPFKDEDDCL